MSDFLSRLAGRTMGLTPSVQPLIPSMYTPRSTPASAQSHLIPFDSDISGPVLPHSNTNPPTTVGTGHPPVQAWATHPFATRDTHQASGRPQEQASTDGFQAFGQPQEQALASDNPLMVQAGPHQEIEGDRALPLQEGYTDKTHKNHPLPDNGSSSSHPLNAVSQHNLGHSPAFQPGPPTTAAHKDRPSILAQETTLHHRGISSWPPNGSEQMRRADQKDENYKNAQFAQDDHILPLNESPQSNEASPSSAEFSQAVISVPNPLSIQNSSSAWTGTSKSPYRPTHTNDERRESRPSGNVPHRAENDLERETRRNSSESLWHEARPLQGLSAPTARYGNLQRGNLGAITQPMERNETPSTGATAPNIQVTIGRIEVRATPPPPTRAPAQRKVPSVMSLDDYINQRTKGGL